jgi:putative ABC transport system permease protein
MILDYLKISFLMMRSKPVRSFLSLLGIYIGVLSLVIILAIRHGIQHQIEDLYRTYGARVIFVQPGFDQTSRQIGHLTRDDVVRLNETPGILSALSRTSTEFDVRTAAATHHAKIIGIDDQFIALYRVRLLRGRTFIQEEVSKKQPVCLLSDAIGKTLFPLSDPMGTTIDLNGMAFHVIGIVDWSHEAGARSSITDADIFVPPDWLRSSDANDNEMISMLEVRVSETISPAQAVRLVKTTISHDSPQRENLYFVRSIDQMVERSRRFNDKILGGLLGIAGISLLVGGIGVANVMVTSVTERTREVGIRKALGARRVDILYQFLVESIVLSASGGVLAVGTGMLGVQVVPLLFSVSAEPVVPLAPALGCVAVTIVIGLLAGVYPASYAAHLSPAEALRYE